MRNYDVEKNIAPIRRFNLVSAPFCTAPLLIDFPLCRMVVVTGGTAEGRWSVEGCEDGNWLIPGS